MSNSQRQPLSPYQVALLDDLLAHQTELRDGTAPTGPQTLVEGRGGRPWLSKPVSRRLAVRSVTAALVAAAVVLAVVPTVPGGIPDGAKVGARWLWGPLLAAGNGVPWSLTAHLPELHHLLRTRRPRAWCGDGGGYP